MTLARGDVMLAWFPFASGTGVKRRPCIVVQNDRDNRNLANTIVAMVTTNRARIGDPSHFLIDVSTKDGGTTGLLHDSVVSCNNISTIERNMIDKTIGVLPPALLLELNRCLKEALAIP
jgi:mRNA interferase MazF